MSHSLDRYITLSGDIHTLRFSMGALAKMSSRLRANSPGELADCLRFADLRKQKETGLILLNSVLLEQEVSSVSDKELETVLSLIADMIVEAFHV